jgi:hypothetical protein
MELSGAPPSRTKTPVFPALPPQNLARNRPSTPLARRHSHDLLPTQLHITHHHTKEGTTVNPTERIANLLISSITGFRATFCERLHIDGSGQEAILLLTV